MDGTIDTYYAALQKAGLTDIQTFSSQHSQAIEALGITSTQRALYGAYVTSGNEGVMEKLSQLVQAQDAEAVQLYEQYAATQDITVLTNYISNAGKLITIETLLQADISYIQGSSALIAGIDGQLDAKSGALMTGVKALQNNYSEFDASIQQLVTSLSSLTENMAALKGGIDTLVTSYATLDSGIGQYTQAVAQIVAGYENIYHGSLDIASGTKELYGGTSQLVEGTLTLYEGSTELKQGTETLTEGTTKFQNETETMDTQIETTIDETIADLTGENVETVSFVSEKNTNVQSVLFVIKTPAIVMPEVEEVEITQEETLTLWQKFLRLFGLY